MLKNRANITSFEFNQSLHVGKNVTKILDRILKGYDKLVRPNYSGNIFEIKFDKN